MPADNTKEIKAQIKTMKKEMSLPKIAKASGVSYPTLIMLMSGKTKSLSNKVAGKLTGFLSGGGVVKGGIPAVKAKRGPKPGAGTRIPARVKAQSSPTIRTPEIISGIGFRFAGDLEGEMKATKAHLEYLLTIQDAQNKYWKLVGKK